jgi:valyl-tRNA synthetase
MVERDATSERARLERELAEVQQLVQRSRDLLARPGFAEKAPPDVVAKERAKLQEREARLSLLEGEATKRRG